MQIICRMSECDQIDTHLLKCDERVYYALSFFIRQCRHVWIDNLEPKSRSRNVK